MTGTTQLIQVIPMFGTTPMIPSSGALNLKHGVYSGGKDMKTHWNCWYESGADVGNTHVSADCPGTPPPDQGGGLRAGETAADRARTDSALRSLAKHGPRCDQVAHRQQAGRHQAGPGHLRPEPDHPVCHHAVGRPGDRARGRRRRCRLRGSQGPGMTRESVIPKVLAYQSSRPARII